MSLSLRLLLTVLVVLPSTAPTAFARQAEQMRSWATLGRVEELKSLLAENPGLDVNLADEEGWTALMYASKGGRLEMIETLLELGAHVHSGNNAGETSLHIAAKQGQTQVIGTLLDAGIDLRATDSDGRTALYRAIEHHQAEATELLQAEGQARQERDPSLRGLKTTAPRPLEIVDAEYSDAARADGIEGDVVLRILVHRDGTVGASRVVEGLHPDLDRNALNAIKKWMFEPARRGGQPVHTVADIRIPFELPES